MSRGFKEIRYIEESDYQILVKKAADWDKLKDEKQIQTTKYEGNALTQSGAGRSGSGPNVVDEDFRLHSNLVQPDPDIIEPATPRNELDWNSILQNFEGKNRGHAQTLLNNLKNHNEISIVDGKLTLNGNAHDLETVLSRCLNGQRKHTTSDEDEFLGFLKSNKLWHKVRSVSEKSGHWMYTGSP